MTSLTRMMSPIVHQMEKDIILVNFTEALSANRFTAPHKIVLQGEQGSIVKIDLTSIKQGTGTLRSPTGAIHFFDAVPSVSLDDSDLVEADAELLIGSYKIISGDWLVATTTALATLFPDIPYNIPGKEIWVVGFFSTVFVSDASNGEAIKLNELGIEYKVV